MIDLETAEAQVEPETAKIKEETNLKRTVKQASAEVKEVAELLALVNPETLEI